MSYGNIRKLLKKKIFMLTEPNHGGHISEDITVSPTGQTGTVNISRFNITEFFS